MSRFLMNFDNKIVTVQMTGKLVRKAASSRVIFLISLAEKHSICYTKFTSFKYSLRRFGKCHSCGFQPQKYPLSPQGSLWQDQSPAVFSQIRLMLLFYFTDFVTELNLFVKGGCSENTGIYCLQLVIKFGIL